MSWSQGVVELIRWRQRRRREARQVADLVEEAERWLVAQRPPARPDQIWPPIQESPPA